MDKIQFSQKTQEIRTKYNRIHKILFTYGVFLLIALFAIIKVYAILSSEKDETANENPLKVQKDIKIQEFINKVDLIQKQQTLTGSIALGQFQETKDYIESFNNLLYYKGFVIPRFFWISKTAPLQSIEYFNKGTYTVDELDILFKNIFIGSNKNTSQPPRNISFPLTKGIIEEFNLQCLFQSKISPLICNIFISTFLDEFFVHAIETDNDIFFTIINKLLKEKKYNEKGCKQLLYYTYYTEKENNTTERLLEQCHPSYKEKYRLFIDFSEVQKELFSKFISNKIYKDETINVYKLISFQQIINDDITNKIINIDRINGYFSFLQELLKRDKIGLFYKELTYFFNNYYLKKAIENIEITSKIANKTEIDIIAKQIITINNGNQLIGYMGLREQINKNILETELSLSQEDKENESYEQKIENLLLQIKDIEIKQKFLSGNNILIYGIRKIQNKINNSSLETKTISIPTKLRLEENKNTLTLKQIVLEGFNEISQTINKLIETQKRSFADLQKYIYQNSSLFGTVTPIKEEEVEIICKELSNTLTGQEVKICNNNKIDIDIFRKNKVITMTIIHTNFLLNKIDVSDEEAKKLLDEYLKDPDILSQMTYSKITKLEFVSFLQKTIAGFISFIPKDDGSFEGSSNTIIIIERIKKYLGIQVNDIVEKNDKILIDFTITGIPFLGYYNIQENKITPIYFKEANTTKTPVAIKNIALTLSDEGKPFLNLFLLQPLEIIKQYSPEEYLIYQKFISEKY
ncbi:hypothetical protein P148_SR1C00001G0654 [candidate division SR1 bacterium RAAC1_SR1_1]|nr:hypothetical protein P148_SR1C00001G0654 [candidate division SR1 bacterium RAAC1_SR1_1]